MADFVRASHAVYGTLEIPASWVTLYPGVWTVLDPEDPPTPADPLPIYVRDAELPDLMASHVGDGSAFDLAQRAALETDTSGDAAPHSILSTGV